MKLDEAKAECQRWFDYLKRQEDKSYAIQQISADVRAGRTDSNTARRMIRALDNGLTVYDGSRLRDAVRVLISHVDGQSGERKNEDRN